MAFPLVCEGARGSLFFGVYEKLMEMLGRQQQTAPSYADIVVAAAVGGGVQGVAATPIELVKIQMQASSTGQFSLD